MFTTSLTLLERLRDPRDAGAWHLLLNLYAPLLRRWLHTPGLQTVDVEDLTQDVLAVVAQKMPGFVHNQHPGAFRTWLKTIAVHKLRDHLRSDRNRTRSLPVEHERWLADLEDSASGLSREWDRQHDQHVARQLLELLRPEFTVATWEAFRLLVLESWETTAVAKQLGLSVNAVMIAKSRVLARLRQELRFFTDL